MDYPGSDGRSKVWHRLKQTALFAPAIWAALELQWQGADIADVFRLVATKGTEAFVTFYKGMKGDARIGVDAEVV